MFTKRDYSKYKHSKIETDCLFCGYRFEIPSNHSGVTVTCSKYCSGRLTALKKQKGEYFLCSMCDKPVFKTPNKRKSTDKVYCSRGCQSLGWTHLREHEGSYKKYYGSNWFEQRRKARKRDSFKCQDCALTEEEYGMELSVHHIVPFVYFDDYKLANNLSNLVSLCEPCHRVRHSGAGHPRKFIEEKIITQAKPTVFNAQREKAEEVFRLLTETSKTLKEVSDISKLSYSGVSRIYHGKRWTELYNEPPRATNPRAKSKL